MITAICQECGKQFEYELKPGFPRKYCPECSAKKKAEYEGKKVNLPDQEVTAYSKPIVPGIQVVPKGTPVDLRETAKHDIVISRTEKPHSYEFGKAGARHKIYYDRVNELTDHIRMLKAEGLVEEDIRDIPD